MNTVVDEPDESGVVRLRDGRKVAWSSWGPRDGRVVLLSPGAGTSRRLGLASGVAADAGVRLISHDRPGFGESDPVEFRTVAGVGRDLGELCRELALGSPAILANLQGAPFALAAAALGVVESVALVSPSDEVAHPEVYEMLSPEHREIVDLVATDVESARSHLGGLDAAALRTMILGASSAVDREVYESPGFVQVWQRATEDAFAHSAEHYAADTILAMSPWGIDLTELTVPVTLWMGAADTAHSPDLGITLARRLRARRTVVEGAGGSLLWTHGRRVLALGDGARR